MNLAHQRGQASTSSVRSFDESNEHATDYISGMYQEQSSSPLNNHKSPTPPRKKLLPPPPPPPKPTSNSSYSKSGVQSTPQGSTFQRTSSSDSNSSSPERRSPTHGRPRLRPPSPPPPLSTQMPLSSFNNDNDGSSPTSPADIAKELSNLQAFKRMSLDVSNQVSDPDLPSNNRMSIPDMTELMEAGVDQDAARLLWVPAHLHPEIAANDDWKDFVQRRVEETKTTGTISRVKSIGGGSSQRRLSRSKSILSRQIDPSDEETYSKYSDAGHAELERRASKGPGSPTERHMITVAELEKLEALIKEGALERQGRPVSGEGIELESIPPLAADVPPPAVDVPPLIPMKGTLKRSAHTSMRNVRRGMGRTTRRSSEPRKAGSRTSQDSVYDEDGIPPSAISPTSPPPHERSESLSGLDTIINDGQNGRLSVDVNVDKSRTSAPAIMEQLDLQNIGRSVVEVQSPEQIIESDEAVLGQVQPRQLRRPPLRRQTVDAPESLSYSHPPPSPSKDKPPPPEKPLKKSPVSPVFPPVPAKSPPPPPVPEPIASIPEEAPSQLPTQQYQSVPAPPPYQPYTPTAQPEQPAPAIPPKRGSTWSRLFTSSSDDEQTKEKVSNKGKIKKAASYSESSKSDRSEQRSSVETDRKSLVETSITPPIITTTPPPPVAPSPSPPPQTSTKQPGKKESGLFASIFGSKKKSESKEKTSKTQDSTAAVRPASQDRSQYARHGPGGWGDVGVTAGPPVLNYYYTRFPIHVERAIYRLSHIKLANPRRPLLQQVLLSNFMYGYLNLINKAAQPQQQQQQQQQQPQQPEMVQPVQQQQESYVEQPSQQEEHVFYTTEDQNDYYGQDYYGAEYEDDQDDTVPQGHETGDFGYDYQPPDQQNPSQNSTYNNSYDPQTNGRRHDDDDDDDDDDVGNTYIIRDSRGRTQADQDPPYTAKRYHS